MVVRQIMVELHGSQLPTMVEIFQEFQKNGYVMFHKEANYLNGGGAIEAAFLLLSKEFQTLTSLSGEEQANLEMSKS